MHDATYPVHDASAEPVEVHPIVVSGAPVIVIGFDGSIKEISAATRQLMGPGAIAPVGSNFFTLVHKNNLYPVMRDVADIVCRGKSKAQWLLRLRTPRGAWKWFRAEVRKSYACKDCINLVLTSV